jgi:hypothetical protein
MKIFHWHFYSRKQLLTQAGFLTSPSSCAFPSTRLKVAHLQEKQVGVTAAGTAPELHRIPFYSTLHGHQRCDKGKRIFLKMKRQKLFFTQ